jgi:quercetin dioxygenase-like cupin family protein
MSDFSGGMEAALLAAGALTAHEQEALRKRLKTDPRLAAEVREWEDALAPLALLAPPEAAPEDLLARIEARLHAGGTFDALSRVLREGQGKWITASPGMRVKLLHRMPEIRRQTVLLDIDPGASYPGHAHEQDEEIYIISGDLVIGSVVLGPGDFHVSPKGSRHPAATSRGGCRCIVALSA